MQRPVGTILVVAIVLLAGAAEALARVEVHAQVESQMTIYPGQRFTYSVVVSGGKPERVDIALLAPFQPQRTGSGNSIKVLNNRRVVTYSENYAITAEKPGTMVLPSVTVVVDGQTYKTNPVEVTVAEPGTTDRLDLEVTVSTQKCYVGQPVVLTIKWFVKAVQPKDAAFNIPVFKSDEFYLEDVSRSAQAYAKTEVTIHGVSVVVSENRQMIKGMDTAIISFDKVLIPKRPGRITLDPVTVSASIATGRVRTNEIFNPIRTTYGRFSVQSDPIELEVRSLPGVGRPVAFYGLVGPYTIAAAATPTKISVGDPITLTLRIGGHPYLKPVQWPDLETALGGNFKIPTEKASPVEEKGQKVFTQTIRANSDMVTEIPPIPLAYFDTQTGRYAVASTEAIPLEVAPTKVLTNADVEGTGGGTVGRSVQALREGFSANHYGPEVLVNQAFSPVSALVRPGYAVLWSIPLLGFVASVVFKLITKTSPEAVARKRRRGARAVAAQRLKALASVPPEQRPDLQAAALKGYLGDRFGRTAGSLTADDCRDLVADATDDMELANRFRAKISEFEAARYAALDTRVDTAQIDDVLDLVQAVEEKSKQ